MERLKIVNPLAEDIAELFGIDPNRANELTVKSTMIMKEAVFCNGTTKKSELIAKLFDIFETPTELALFMFNSGEMLERVYNDPALAVALRTFKPDGDESANVARIVNDESDESQIIASTHKLKDVA